MTRPPDLQGFTFQRRDHRSLALASRRHLAQAIGRCASANPERVLTSVQALFSATTGDESQDRAVRTTMLDVLEEAVSPETLRDILPVTYTALLHRDQSVRSGGIDLWVACARVADALPGEMSELAIPLLEDRYVIVHKRMLAQMRQLSFPPDLVPKLLPIVLALMATYAEKDDPDTVARAIWAIRCLAPGHPDESQVTGWFSVALAYVGRCSAYDREQLLTA
jgi:hypothetical protein